MADAKLLDIEKSTLITRLQQLDNIVSNDGLENHLNRAEFAEILNSVMQLRIENSNITEVLLNIANDFIQIVESTGM